VQRRIAQFIIVTLVIYMAFISAKMTWFLMSETSHSTPHAIKATAVNSSGNSQIGFDMTKLQALNLFGLYSEQEIEEQIEIVKDAPQTRLQLRLSGLVASDDVKTAAAIIEHKGKQETYGVGDVIIGTRASLEQVLMDRVIIKQSGRLETLMLDGFDFKEPAKSLSSKTKTKNKLSKQSESGVLDHRNNRELSHTAKRLREDLAKNPGKITDYLRIMPKRKKGKIVGYSLRPGKEPEFFKLSGLKTGDVAVQMNGYDLVVPLEAAQALGATKEARDISLLIERNGSLMEVLFSID
jgi:general secretion pathway protein C